MTLRTYITRYKKKLEENPYNITAAEKLQQYNDELTKIDNKLNL